MKTLVQKLFNPGELFENYSKESTIHGVKYLAFKQQHWSGKLFWLILFAISMTLCVKYIIEIYDTRKNDPVMISFSKKLCPTFEIPFSAVTICPISNVRVDKINISRVLSKRAGKLSADEIANLNTLLQVCNFQDDKMLQFTNASSDDSRNVINSIRVISNSFDEMFDKCRYGSYKFESCRNYFHEIITDGGICYTFNMLDHKDLINDSTMSSELLLPSHGKKSQWFLDKEYDTMKIKAYPRRVLGAGIYAGLSLQLKMKASNLNPGCIYGINGFRLLLHSPVEYPSFISQQFYTIPFKKQSNIIIKPQMIYASKRIRPYSPENRQCYFEGEKKLKFFKIYSKSNCELECKTDFVLKACGCVKFFMPRNNVTKVCGNSELQCVHQAAMDYYIYDLERKLLEKQLKRDKKHGKATKNDEKYKKLKKMIKCKCLHSCTSMRYDVEISQTVYDVTEEDSMMASVNLHFKDSYFSRLKRYEIYGFADFLSNSGGTLGLFLGCSVLSFFEIIYHIVWHTLKQIKSRRTLRSLDLIRY